ncbi:MAG: outer membrane lipoprotein-sorting protein [Planctomycetes bacterium]|nr:outer membrane lipoprotein-sorting protein [Planctomycetota bacterium]
MNTLQHIFFNTLALSILSAPVTEPLAAVEGSAIQGIKDSLQLAALNPQEKGLQIAQAIDQMEEGFGDSDVILQMNLQNRHGQSSSRIMRTKTLEVDGDGDKTMIIFNTPKDVKGTALLSFTHKEGDDDQWLFLPAIKRIKRIASRNKSGPFVGSEFAYEDLTSQEVEKFTYEYLRDDTLDGENMWVVNFDPVDVNSGYSVREVWINKDKLRFEQVLFFDRKKDLLKTLRWKDYELYKGQYWRAHTMHMLNNQKGKETTLTWGKYTFDNGFTSTSFSQQALKRAR